MQKTLSIIVPTYNMEALLRNDLQSLVVEKDLLDRIEVLVVNDGSKDRSSEIAHEFESTYPSIFKVIDKPNGNYGSCINTGLKMATGKYVKIMDADDSLLSHNFGCLIKRLSEIDADLVLSDYIKYYGEDDQVAINYDLPCDKILKAVDYYESPALKDIQLPAVTYRREIFRTIHYHQTEGISYTDMEWCFSPMSQVEKIYYMNLPVYRYLLNREGQTMDAQVQLRRFSNVLTSLTTMVNTYAVIEADDEVKSYLAGQLVRHMVYVYRFYLISNKKIDRTGLRQLDNLIKEKCPQAYMKSSTDAYRKKINYRYIEKWRSGENEYIPWKILIKERIFDILGTMHLKMMGKTNGH